MLGLAVVLPLFVHNTILGFTIMLSFCLSGAGLDKLNEKTIFDFGSERNMRRKKTGFSFLVFGTCLVLRVREICADIDEF
jgi:hypothetical protein